MADKFQSIKGFYDILPDGGPDGRPSAALWHRLEDAARRVMGQYGYRNIRLPVVEPTTLFVRSVGEHTDIVEKEMYAWEDALNGDRLALRPEGTAGCVRSVVEHSLTYNGPQRLWYMGPMFRHENVQKGRQRQFHQVGAEAFGFAGPETEAEQIVMLARLWRELGIKDVELQINTIGDAAERIIYRQQLIAYFEQHRDLLDEDARRRLHANPLRILDSKNPRMQEMIEGAPKLFAALGDESRAHYEGFCDHLRAAGVGFVLNTRLVRGLDYYNRSVFEWVTTKLGAQGTIAAGGRYDTLVETLGGKPTPACGFGMGMERVLMMMQEYGVTAADAPEVYLVNAGEQAQRAAPLLAERLRDGGLSVCVHAGGGSFKSQMKKADASGAGYAVILGDDEAAAGAVVVKPLRSQGEQRTVPQAELLAELSR